MSAQAPIVPPMQTSTTTQPDTGSEQSLFLGGVTTAGAIRRAGYDRRDLREALDSGGLVRLRRGWYALPTANRLVVAGVTSGGVLGCVSALKFWGVWTPDARITHVRRSDFGKRRAPSSTVKACAPSGFQPAPSRAVDPVELALRTAALCVDETELVILMDSVLNLKLLSLTRLRYCMDGLSAHHRRLVDRCARAESGTETIARLRLRSAGIRVRTQVRIPTVGRVDLLVGARLVIEVDSRAHHTDPTQYYKDRLRDQKLVALGYLVIRLTYEQVMFDWDETLERIMPIIRRDRHRRLS